MSYEDFPSIMVFSFEFFKNNKYASDNGTWNKTNFLKEMKIDVPSYEEQIKMIAFYENIEQMKTKIESVSNHIGNILKKIVA